MRCAVWYHLLNLKIVKNTWKSVTFSKHSPMVVFHVFKLCKWYQITLSVSYMDGVKVKVYSEGFNETLHIIKLRKRL